LASLHTLKELIKKTVKKLKNSHFVGLNNKVIMAWRRGIASTEELEFIGSNPAKV
jgi:hypothetical protein